MQSNCFLPPLIALLFLTQGLGGTTYYVATDGHDGNSGASESPLRTLQRAADIASAGDSIVVRDGVYGHENAVTHGDDGWEVSTPVVLYNSGSSDAPITIKAENQGGAVLDCEMQCDAYFNLRYASYIVIQGFVITRGYKEAIHSNDSAHHITIRNNRIEYIANRWTPTTLGQSGLYTNENCHDFVIDGNVFHDIGRSDASRYDHGLYLHGYNFTITNNVFYNIPHGWSITAADGMSNVLIANNTFALPQAYGQPGHIMLWDRQSGVTIQNNIFYNPIGHAIARYTSSLDNCSIDHNLVYGASALMDDESGCSVWATKLGEDPNFVNPTDWPYDFHLQAYSPAIGTGAGWKDIGAFPYGAAASLQIINTTTGARSWSVGDGWSITITGGQPWSLVALTVGNWAGNVGYTDGSGSFAISGTALPENVGTATEVWSVGGVTVNPSQVAVTVHP